MRKVIIFFIMFLGIGLSLVAMPEIAKARITRLEMGVDGMIWPIWAYGVQKAVSRLEGVDRVDGNFQEAKLEITLKEREPLEIEKLREAVVKAGFTPTWVRFGATGTLVVRKGFYGLKVEGTGQLLELVKDERADSLVKTLAGETRLIDILAVFPKEKPKALLEEFSIR